MIIEASAGGVEHSISIKYNMYIISNCLSSYLYKVTVPV